MVDLELPPAQVDVNIHPMKLEIRFQDSQRVYQFMQQAVHAAIGSPARPLAPGPEARGSRGPAVMGPESAMAAAAPEADTTAAPRLFAAAEVAAGDDFRVLGQFLDSYIVVERKGELLVIDQHNARERVLFEKLQAGFGAGAASSAQALFPLLLDLTPAEEAELDDERLEAFRRAGFDIRRLSGGTIEIKAFPQFLSEGRIRQSVRAALRESAGERDPAARSERLLASLACHDAVKVNQRLQPEEMRALVRDLFACANPHVCPHRRPIVVTLALDDIERLLKRR